MRRPLPRLVPILLLAVVALGTGMAGRLGAQDAAPTVGLDEENRRYTDPIYGWSIEWDPAAWQAEAQLVMDVDRDGSLLYPDFRLNAVPDELATPAAGEEFDSGDYWRVSLRSSDAAHSNFSPQTAEALGPGNPASCLTGSDRPEIEVVADAAGRPLVEETAERAWVVVRNTRFTGWVYYHECRVLVPGVSLVAISGMIRPDRYAEQAPVLDALLAGLRIAEAGSWTPVAVPTPQPPQPTPVAEETLAGLTFLNPGESSIQLPPGGSRDLELGVVECCYVFEKVPAPVVWSVTPTAGATIDPSTGLLTIDPATPSGSVFTVFADVEEGRRILAANVHVYTPDAKPLVGYWREEVRFACATGAEVVPARPIRELIFRADGTFSVTWQPFELYKDYWGTYTVDPARGTVELVVDGGNDVPPDLDGSGTFAIDAAGRLVLTDLWLGTKEFGPLVNATPAPGEGDIPACGHRFVGPGSTVAIPTVAATPDDAAARTG